MIQEKCLALMLPLPKSHFSSCISVYLTMVKHLFDLVGSGQFVFQLYPWSSWDVFLGSDTKYYASNQFIIYSHKAVNLCFGREYIANP